MVFNFGVFLKIAGAAQAPMEKGFNRFQLVRSVLVGSNGYFAFARRVFWSFVGRVCHNTDPGPRGVLYTNLRAKRPARPGWYAFFTKSWYAFFAKSWYAPKRKNGYAPDRKNGYAIWGAWLVRWRGVSPSISAWEGISETYIQRNGTTHSSQIPPRPPKF